MDDGRVIVMRKLVQEEWKSSLLQNNPAVQVQGDDITEQVNWEAEPPHVFFLYPFYTISIYASQVGILILDWTLIDSWRKIAKPLWKER